MSAASCSTSATAAAPTSPATSGGGRRPGHLGQPGPAGLLGRRAGGRPPPLQRPLAAVAVPADDERAAAHGTTSSTPTSVTSSTASSPRSPLASACTSTIRGAGGGSRATRRSRRAAGRRRPARSPRSPRRRRRRRRAPARSPGRSRRTVAAWRPSAPSSTTDAPAGSASAQEDRARHAAHRPLNASRIWENSPPPCARREPAGERSSPRSSASSRSSSSCSLVEPGRRQDVDVHVQVAAAGAAQVRHAPAAQRDHRARLGARPDVDVLVAVEGVQRRAWCRARPPSSAAAPCSAGRRPRG